MFIPSRGFHPCSPRNSALASDVLQIYSFYYRLSSALQLRFNALGLCTSASCCASSTPHVYIVFLGMLQLRQLCFFYVASMSINGFSSVSLVFNEVHGETFIQMPFNNYNRRYRTMTGKSSIKLVGREKTPKQYGLWAGGRVASVNEQ